MSVPLAYLFTWRTYGSWLPGNERGTVDPLHNRYATPFSPPEESRERISLSGMRDEEFFLGEDARAVVRQTVHDHCRIKGWELHAVNVRTNHAHAVVSCGLVDADRAVEQLKSWSTLRLRRTQLARPDQPVWASKGSARYLWNVENIRCAVDYVLNQQ